MIAITRTASIAPGKTGYAIAYAHQIAKYIEKKHETTFEVLMPVGGNPARIAWHARFESLTKWEELTIKMMADKEYMEMIVKHADAFLPGSIHDSIWRTI